MSKIISIILLGLIKMYQLLLSPLLGVNCRYTPTCSAYAVAAIRKWGPARGGWLALKRIASCRPGGGHGYDPIP